MALARCPLVIQDEAGNLVDAASVEVRRESDNALASLYSDRAGAVAIGNPFTAASGADAGFHVVGGAYKITATKALFARTWRYVGVGLSQETDAASLPLGLFCVDLNGVNQTGLTVNAHNKVLFDHIDFDIDSYYNITTKRYLPLVSGYYEFESSVHVNHDAATRSCMLSIGKNGTRIKGSGFTNFTSAICIGQIPVVSARVPMNGTTDFAEIFAFSPGTNGFVSGNIINTYFTGHRVGNL